MRKSSLLATLLLLMAAWLPAQVNLSLSGTVIDVGTGAGAAGQDVTVMLIDSMTSTTLYAQTTATDSAGDYSLLVSAPNVPATGMGEVGVIDCNGSIQRLQFGYGPGNTTFANIDFTICPNVPVCNASFLAMTQVGSDSVWLTDYSTTTMGFVNGWVWTMGNGDTIIGDPAPAYGYATAGTYQVCLTVTTSSGCTASACHNVTTGAGQGACSATLSYGTLFSGAMGFTLAPSGTNSGVVSVLYDFGDGQTLTTPDTAVAYAYLNGGTYQACATAIFTDGCTATSCTTVTASSGPNCQAGFIAVADTTGQYSLLLVNTSQGGNLDYLWDFGDGGTSTLAYPQHTYAGPGTYHVCLSVTDTALGCLSTFCDSVVVVQKVSTPFTIQVVPPLATVTPEPLGQGGALQAYPQPAGDVLHLRMDLANEAGVSVRVYDLQGALVAARDWGRCPAGAWVRDMDLGELPSGIYILRLEAGGQPATRRLVVAR